MNSFRQLRPSSRRNQAKLVTQSTSQRKSLSLALLSTNLESVVEKLTSKTLWHPTSRMRLIQFLFHTYGIDPVAKAIKARKET